MTQQPQQQRELTPEERTRVEGMKRNWEQKRLVNERLQQIGKRIGVYSGKGGVGKTTIAVNLAVMLAQEGARVGLFDCDIDCPNVTRVMRISDGPPSDDGTVMIPPSRFGVRVMSMAMFQENEEEATIWRGPMIHNAINQFLNSTEWGNPDYMIVDLPPGTSDAPLTVMQTLDLDGFVIVTTPHELAVLDAKRSINMIKKMNLKVLGIVENMSGGVFGTGGGQALAEEMELPFLGGLTMSADYMNSQKPASLESDSVAAEFATISEGLSAQINIGKSID